MVATARAAQLSDDALRNLGAIKLVAPAKVNLFLSVGERRVDGYHSVQNIMHAIALHDVLYLRRLTDYAAEDLFRVAEEAVTAKESAVDLAGPCGNIVVKIECVPHKGVAPLDIPVCDNIVFKAIDALAREVGRTQREAVSVRIEKHIPHQGGLGGGSSNAAAALLGAARMWGLTDDDPALWRTACRLGADVAFFLKGGCALFSGCGEKFERSLVPMKKSVVLIKPEGGVPTAAAYRAFDEAPVVVDAALSETALAAGAAQDVPLVNNLAPAAESILPELAEVRTWALSQQGVESVLLCGSGATTFAVMSDFSQAMRVAAAAQAQGWWARTTMFASVKADVVP
ncbi:MAG: 4-(cytidine 5'-diphospho)-2-C-methyl-D-erythritol kinase [Eggerthellaceae bacterium]|nr:4-(cytidine 5'-diphospho)-2-C-methyl-D-erythritol kinase [Eggerthellaceae bacterium]